MIQFSVNKTRGWWWTISAIAIAISIGAMAFSFANFSAPLRPGLDFVGGTRLQIERDCSLEGNCTKPIDVARVRQVLETENLGNSTIQLLGDNKQILAVRTQELKVERRTQLQTALSQEIGQFDPKTIQIDSVGPTIGRELFASGLLALIISFFGIIVYLSVRFQFDYALFAILALFHDVFITAGIFCYLGFNRTSGSR